MNEHGTLSDSSPSLPAQSCSDGIFADLQRDVLSDDMSSSSVASTPGMQSPQQIANLNSEHGNSDKLESTVSSIPSTPDDRGSSEAEDRDWAASGEASDEPVTEESGLQPAQHSPDDIQAVSYSRDAVRDDYAPLQSHPWLHHGSSDTRPTTASSRRETEEARTLPSRLYTSKLSRSQSMSQPCNSHDNENGRPRSPPVTRSSWLWRRDEGDSTALLIPMESDLTVPEFTSSQDEPGSEVLVLESNEHLPSTSEPRSDLSGISHELSSPDDHKANDENIFEEHSPTYNVAVPGTTRASAHEDLASDDLQDGVQLLQTDCDQKNESIAAYKNQSTSQDDGNVVKESSGQNSMNWKDMYEKMKQHYDLLEQQHRRLRSEAERIYRLDLERKYEECQASLIEAQDRIQALTEDRNKFEKESLSWLNETKQAQEELAHRSAQSDQQADINQQELLDAVREYRQKIEDNAHWDKECILVKYERLERDSAALNALQQCHIEKLNKIIQEQEDKLQAPLQEQEDERPKPASKILRLREARRKEEKSESEREALKEKLRQMAYESAGLPANLASGKQTMRYWFARWHANEYYDDLTEEEQETFRSLQEF